MVEGSIYRKVFFRLSAGQFTTLENDPTKRKENRNQRTFKKIKFKIMMQDNNRLLDYPTGLSLDNARKPKY